MNLTIIMFLNAPRGSNLNLLAQVLMGVTLFIGMLLARRRYYRAHGFCQSVVVLLNLVPIAIYMWPVFHRAVLPKIPAGLGKAFYALPVSHAIVATLAEVLGLYIILRAGTNLLPAALRFKNYKLWMRTELLLWWFVIVLGLSTYGFWYRADASAATPTVAATRSSAGAASNTTQRMTPLTATVTLTNFAFEPKELTVEPGTTVIWKNATGHHAVKADDESFESDVLDAGGEFRYKFDREGRFPIYCTLHGAPGGHDMSGVIIVKARQR